MGGGPLHYSVTPVQTESQELGVRSLEFGVRSWSGLRLDFRLTIGIKENILLSLFVIIAVRNDSLS